MTKKELVELLADIQDDVEVQVDCPGLGYVDLEGVIIISGEPILYVE